MTPLPCNLLQDRLNKIRRILPLAARRAKEDPEHVHQLRIATRESLAALDAYRSLLPSEATAWLRKRLKRIRLAAGEARDLDVMLTEHRFSKSTGHKKLTECLRDQRIRAQQPLVKTHKRISNNRRFKRHVNTCLGTLRSVSPERIVETGINQAFAAASSLMHAFPGKNVDIDTLHQFRIKAKKLRYCLELVGQSETEESFKLLLATACEIQKKLGAVNDHIVAADRFKQIEEKASSDKFARYLKRQSKRERHQAKQARRNFLNWWDADRRAHTRRLCEALILDRDTGIPKS